MIRHTTIALLALSITGCNTTSASAGWPHDQFENQPRVQRHYRPAKHRHHHKQKVIYRAAPKPASDALCRAPAEGLGTQWHTISGAEDKALDAWLAKVRWDLGEKFIDPTKMRGATYQCSRSSVGEIEFMGVHKVLYRCRLIATPCQAEKKAK